MWGVFLVAQVLVHLGIERGLDGELDQLLGEGAEIFFRLDVFGQLSGQCFEFVLVHLLTHEGILLKKLLIRGRLHNWIYRLFLCAPHARDTTENGISLSGPTTSRFYQISSASWITPSDSATVAHLTFPAPSLVYAQRHPLGPQNAADQPQPTSQDISWRLTPGNDGH